MTQIDLGDITEQPASSAARPLDWRALRRAALVAVLLVTAVLVTASERPRQHGLRPLWSEPLADGTTSMVLTTDALYAYEQVDDEHTRLTAHDVGNGAVRWSVPIGDGVSHNPPTPAAGMLLISLEHLLVETKSADGSSSTDEYTSVTGALRASTGAVAWRADGGVLAFDDATVLLGDRNRAGLIYRMRLVRLGDGSPIWTIATPGIRSWAVDYAGTHPQHLITATDQGDIKIYPYADGSSPRTGRLPWVAWGYNGAAGTDLTAGDGYLITDRREPNRGSVTTVYDERTFAQRRQMTDMDGQGAYLACGAQLLCALTETGVVAYDTTSGRERWRLPEMHTATFLGTDRLIAADSPDSATFQLIDAATGRPVGSAVAGNLASPSGSYLGRPGGRPISEALVLSPVHEPLGRTAVTKLDVITGRRYLLGTIDQVGDDLGTCQSVPGYLACDDNKTSRMRVTAVG
jgi:outer membrane protein assembly factor BamB